MRINCLLGLVVITACSSNHPVAWLPRADVNTDASTAETATIADATFDTATPARDAPIDGETSTQLARDGAIDTQIDTEAATPPTSDSAIVAPDTPAIASRWQCPKGQGFGVGELLNWPLTITGSERVSASGTSVVWRAFVGAPLSVADATSAGTFAPVSDITATNACGAFSISRDGLAVVCVSPDGSNLEIARRSAIGTDFGTPSSSEFSTIMSALSAALATDGGSFAIAQPIFASGDSTLFFQVQGVGVYETLPTPPDASWSSPTFVYGPTSQMLDGAYNASTLFLWDSSTLTTSIAWQWADASWTLDPLGGEQRVTPNPDCAGAYFFSNTLLYAPW